MTGGPETIITDASETVTTVPGSATALPDHPMRHARWFQLLDRLWRPLNGWVSCPLGVAYLFIVGPMTGTAPSEGYAALLLGYSAAVYGIKTVEKIRGVA